MSGYAEGENSNYYAKIHTKFDTQQHMYRRHGTHLETNSETTENSELFTAPSH